MGNILLGPLLGVESETRYSVCLLLDQWFETLFLEISSWNLSVEPDYFEAIGGQYYFYRLVFNLPENFEGIFKYAIKDQYREFLHTHYDFHYWTVSVRNKIKLPTLAFVSCNGRHDIPPEKIPPAHFNGWEAILKSNPDFLFLTGDQVYADSLINCVPGLQDYFNGIVPFDQTLEKAVDAFYIKRINPKSWGEIKHIFSVI